MVLKYVSLLFGPRALRKSVSVIQWSVSSLRCLLGHNPRLEDNLHQSAAASHLVDGGMVDSILTGVGRLASSTVRSFSGMKEIVSKSEVPGASGIRDKKLEFLNSTRGP